MRRFPGALLGLTILVCCLSPALAAEEEALFPAVKAYEGFEDVQETDWFAPYVKLCVETGLMNGVGDGRFDPQGKLTGAEAVTLALRIHHVRNGGDGTLPHAPEEWGRMTLTFADGEVWSGYCQGSKGGEGWYLTGRTGSQLCFDRPEGWEGKDYQQVTLDLGGRGPDPRRGPLPRRDAGDAVLLSPARQRGSFRRERLPALLGGHGQLAVGQQARTGQVVAGRGLLPTAGGVSGGQRPLPQRQRRRPGGLCVRPGRGLRRAAGAHQRN